MQYTTIGQYKDKQIILYTDKPKNNEYMFGLYTKHGFVNFRSVKDLEDPLCRCADYMVFKYMIENYIEYCT